MIKGPLKPQKVSSLRKDKNNDSRTNLRNTVDSDKKEDDEDKMEEQIQGEQDDTVTHKKKRKRNVDARDAWTQTDRSDYMLIKYRQK